MAKPKLTYFDFSASRGEDCRLALFIAGVDFEDNRIKREQWLQLKPNTPFGALPVLELEGKGTLAQSNVILSFIGKHHDLMPEDPWVQAQHEALMAAVEDVRARYFATSHIEDEPKKKEAREKVTEQFLRPWARSVASRIEGPFVAGDTLSVADIKLHGIMKFLTSGNLDHVPTDVFADQPELTGVYEAVRTHPRVVEWYAHPGHQP